MYKTIEILDSPEADILQHFLECIKFIEKAINEEKGCILVHCFAGKSRSSSVVIAYLMWKWMKPLEEVFAFVKKQRPIVQPNTGKANCYGCVCSLLWKGSGSS